MAAIGTKLRSVGPTGLAFKCPGCKTNHQVCKDRWTWNQSGDAPTFQPSVLVTGIRHDLTDEEFDEAVALPEGVDRTTHPKFGMRCHSFVTDGMIQYLSDCHHDLKGQTIPMPDWVAADKDFEDVKP
jgi:hypothetical protein